MRVSIVNDVWREGMSSPPEVFAEFPTLTGWSEALAAAGADVTVFQRFPVQGRIDRNGVSYRFVSDEGCGAADLVHVNGVMHPRRIRRLRSALPLETSIVVQDHGGFDPAAISWIKRAWIRRGLSAADALVVAAADQALEWRRTGIVPADLPIADVMESSTTLEPVPRNEAIARRHVEGAPSLLWVGRLVSNKDPLTMLRGVASFFETHPDARLTMVYGAATLESEVRAYVRSHVWLAPRVRLVGAVPHEELAAYYSAADIFVAASRHEGSGYAVIEALACGAMPVVTDIAPCRALTDRGRVGVLWEPGRSDLLARALTAAAAKVSDEARRDSRQIFRDRFSWSAIGQHALSIYQDVWDRRLTRVRPPMAVIRAAPGR